MSCEFPVNFFILQPIQRLDLCNVHGRMSVRVLSRMAEIFFDKGLVNKSMLLLGTTKDFKLQQDELLLILFEFLILFCRNCAVKYKVNLKISNKYFKNIEK